MRHFISPINILGSLYCAKFGAANKRTITIFPDLGTEVNLAALNTDEPHDSWYLKPSSVAPGVGNIMFGVSCVDYIDFKFTWDKDSYNDDFYVKVFVNGVQQLGIGHDVPEYSNPDVLEPPLRNTPPIVPRLAGGVTSTFRLTLPDTVCGNVVELYALAENVNATSLVYILCEITGYG